jgi:hypothetical protein
MLPQLVALKPENSWLFVPFMLFYVRIQATRLYVINICCLKHLDVCKLEYLLFISIAVLFCLSRFLKRILAGKISFARVACRQSGEEEGPYPAGGVGYPRLALLCPLATCWNIPDV